MWEVIVAAGIWAAPMDSPQYISCQSGYVVPVGQECPPTVIHHAPPGNGGTGGPRRGGGLLGGLLGGIGGLL